MGLRIPLGSALLHLTASFDHDDLRGPQRARNEANNILKNSEAVAVATAKEVGTLVAGAADVVAVLVSVTPVVIMESTHSRHLQTHNVSKDSLFVLHLRFDLYVDVSAISAIAAAIDQRWRRRGPRSVINAITTAACPETPLTGAILTFTSSQIPTMTSPSSELMVNIGSNRKVDGATVEETVAGYSALSPGIIVGIAVGVVAAFVLAVGVTFYVIKSQTRHSNLVKVADVNMINPQTADSSDFQPNDEDDSDGKRQNCDTRGNGRDVIPTDIDNLQNVDEDTKEDFDFFMDKSHKDVRSLATTAVSQELSPLKGNSLSDAVLVKGSSSLGKRSPSMQVITSLPPILPGPVVRTDTPTCDQPTAAVGRIVSIPEIAEESNASIPTARKILVASRCAVMSEDETTASVPNNNVLPTGKFSAPVKETGNEVVAPAVSPSLVSPSLTRALFPPSLPPLQAKSVVSVPVATSPPYLLPVVPDKLHVWLRDRGFEQFEGELRSIGAEFVSDLNLLKLEDLNDAGFGEWAAKHFMFIVRKELGRATGNDGLLEL